MRVLMIGDVIGKPGRRAIASLLPGLRDDLALDLVVANGENSAGGFGITSETADELLSAGVDVITSGNHIWDQKEIIPHLDSDLPVLRPLNYPPGVPGRGSLQVGDALVVNLLGRVFVGNWDCPFRAIDHLLNEIPDPPKAVLVDLHAEATAEKVAMGWYLDGRVSAVVGTHTHVPTADCKVLPGGTGFVSDLGMVGAVDSILGVETEGSLNRFLSGYRYRMKPVRTGLMNFNSVLIDVDDSTGLATSVERVDRQIEV